MFEWIIANGWVFWLVLFLVLAVIEMVSLDLYFIMLGLGALGGVTAALLGAEFWLQALVFCALSLVLIFMLRPLAIKHLRKAPESLRTNIERLIGEEALVLEPTSRLMGSAKIGGEIWTARTELGAPLQPGTYGSVVRIEGATAYLRPRDTE